MGICNTRCVSSILTSSVHSVRDYNIISGDGVATDERDPNANEDVLNNSGVSSNNTYHRYMPESPSLLLLGMDAVLTTAFLTTLLPFLVLQKVCLPISIPSSGYNSTWYMEFSGDGCDSGSPGSEAEMIPTTTASGGVSSKST